jgi:hypothetical protein
MSKGARALRGLAGHREMTEQEMAEEDQQGDDVLAINRNGWQTVVVQLDQLLDVAETGGVQAAKAWLTVRGVAWSEVGDVEQRFGSPERWHRPHRIRPARPPGRARSRKR